MCVCENTRPLEGGLGLCDHGRAVCTLEDHTHAAIGRLNAEKYSQERGTTAGSIASHERSTVPSLPGRGRPGTRALLSRDTEHRRSQRDHLPQSDSHTPVALWLLPPTTWAGSTPAHCPLPASPRSGIRTGLREQEQNRLVRAVLLLS